MAFTDAFRVGAVLAFLVAASGANSHSLRHTLRTRDDPTVYVDNSCDTACTACVNDGNTHYACKCYTCLNSSTQSCACAGGDCQFSGQIDQNAVVEACIHDHLG